MLMADGCVQQRPKKSAEISLQLALKDAAHVKAFGSFLGTERPITNYTGRDGVMVRMQVSSNRLAASLARFGVVPRKTYCAKVLCIEKSVDFWRGMIDGDGWVSTVKRQQGRRPRPVIGLCGTGEIVNQFTDFVFTRLGWRPRPFNIRLICGRYRSILVGAPARWRPFSLW